MASNEDDARHAPEPNARPLWNEGYWFTFEGKLTYGARAGCSMREHGYVEHDE
jgi:hypothetical protein